MTLIQPPLMVTGGTHPARALRMMIRDLSRGSQGITEGGDLRVRATFTPGPTVRVGNGSAIITGATWGQGSYTQANAGDHVVPIAPTGGTGRTDLVCLRVEDPEYEGSRDPATQDIGYIHVIPGVSANTTTVPPGMTAIPLARITQPPNCATVTDSMITDLRRIANPRRDRKLHTINGFPYSALPEQAGVWQDDWPPNAKVITDVPIWATTANVVATLSGVRVWGESFFGVRLRWGSGWHGNEYQVDTDTITYMSKINVIASDAPYLDSNFRGRPQELRLQCGRYNEAKGGGDVSASTALIFDVEFIEGVY
ncbi:hypothetical protein F4556_005060 [Kitasatospora gansuensis]|uniref:Uncharacterized protein n=1 Tax=Kitasatospora gansuensis TaxID=258050 RepID=A0A7W7SFI4_9ACTN|nr:hypothetical protein [Kitasatospora gansuensis]MBB4949525.1 hypothetical protein [Kitasatospora gansuensis]